MWTGRFDPGGDTIWVPVVLHGPRDQGTYMFILDTGTPTTTIDPDIIDVVGYSPKMSKGWSRSIGMGGVESGYVLEVSRLDVMGVTVGPINVACANLPSGMGIDGLIGTDLLAGRFLTIDWIRGLLSVGT